MWTSGNRRRLPLLALALTTTMFLQSFSTLNASPATGGVSEFKLANGLQVVVVSRPSRARRHALRLVSRRRRRRAARRLRHRPLPRAPDVQVDGQDRVRRVLPRSSRLGGQDNAFTSHDVTGYFQRISKDRLKTVMEMEADRMVNLKLDEKEVATEREVILEERRSRTENNPSSILSEQMSAALYQNHPYRIPIIGWMHEMAKLSREDALAFYKRHYAPNNAIVVVAGDVTCRGGEGAGRGDLRHLEAQRRYPGAQAPAGAASIARRAASSSRTRAPAMPRCAASISRPAITKAAEGEAEALVPAHEDRRQRHHQPPLPEARVEEKLASSAGGWYSGQGLDSGSIGVYAVAAAGRRPRQGRGWRSTRCCTSCATKRGHRRTSSSAPRRPTSPISSTRSTARASLARRYGQGMLVGLTIEQINAWPAAISKVTAGGREARRGQVPRHPPLGHRHADPDRTGLADAMPRKRAADKS